MLGTSCLRCPLLEGFGGFERPNKPARPMSVGTLPACASLRHSGDSGAERQWLRRSAASGAAQACTREASHLALLLGLQGLAGLEIAAAAVCGADVFRPRKHAPRAHLQQPHGNVTQPGQRGTGGRPHELRGLRQQPRCLSSATPRLGLVVFVDGDKLNLPLFGRARCFRNRVSLAA